MAEEGLQEKTSIFTRSYKRKDGTVGYSYFTQTYKVNGKNRGRPKTEESILIAEIKKLSDENKRKMMKYLEKIKEREQD